MNRPTDIFENPGGRRGIRTPGTRNSYGSLANCWFQPLTHPSRVRYRIAKHCLSNAGAKLAIYFRPAKFIRNLFSKNLSLCSFLLIYLALSALFSTKSHHPPLSSPGPRGDTDVFGSEGARGTAEVRILFHHEVAKFSPRGKRIFSFLSRHGRHRGGQARTKERGRLPE